MAILAFKTAALAKRGQPIASACVAGDVAGSVAGSARGRDADHVRDQRRASADVAEWRFRDVVRPVPAAGLARALSRPEDRGI